MNLVAFRRFHASSGLLMTLLCSVFLAFVATSRADAGPASELALATEHFDRGNAFVESGNFAAAAIEFEQAHALSHDDAVLHNLGMTYVVLYRPVEAAAALSRYLEHEGERLSSGERGALAQLISEQNRRIGNLSLEVEPAGAQVRLDGRDLGTDSVMPLRLALGAHELEVSLAGHEREQRTVVLTEARTNLRVALRAALPATTPEAQPTLPPKEAPSVLPLMAARPTQATAPAALSKRGTRLRRVGIATLVTGLGAGLAALGVYVIANARFDTWQKQQGHLDALAQVAHQLPSDASLDPLLAMQADNDDLLRAVWRMDRAAVALAAIGGGLALSGATLMWQAKRRRDARSPALGLTMMGLRLALRARF
jgi:hypothetical protein